MTSSLHPALVYLSLPESHEPSPSASPIPFLSQNLRNLPAPLLREHFSLNGLTTPRTRTQILLIRNRRTRFALDSPARRNELGWEKGSTEVDPAMWNDLVRTTAIASDRSASQPQPPLLRPGIVEGEKEKEWADNEFMGYTATKKGHVGRLGELLAEYEEEREAERLRTVRREQISRARETEEEFEEEEEEEEESDEEGPVEEEKVSMEQLRTTFERMLREKFIDGRLSGNDSLYDSVDFDEEWDPDSRDDEDRWFDESEEEEN